MLTILVIVLVLGLLLVALAGIRELRREPVVPLAERPLDGVVPVPGPVERGPPHPVVLVHGLLGFDRIGRHADLLPLRS